MEQWRAAISNEARLSGQQGVPRWNFSFVAMTEKSARKVCKNGEKQRVLPSADDILMQQTEKDNLQLLLYQSEAI